MYPGPTHYMKKHVRDKHMSMKQQCARLAICACAVFIEQGLYTSVLFIRIVFVTDFCHPLKCVHMQHESPYYRPCCFTIQHDHIKTADATFMRQYRAFVM